jgi:hypothetical protein
MAKEATMPPNTDKSLLLLFSIHPIHNPLSYLAEPLQLRLACLEIFLTPTSLLAMASYRLSTAT